MKQFQQIFLLNEDTFEIINLKTNQQHKLTFNQFLLLSCLIDGKGKKSELIRIIWEDNNVIVSDGSYHQLIFQTRSIITKIGLPSKLVKTLPRYGLKLVGVEEIFTDTSQLMGPEPLQDEEHKNEITQSKNDAVPSSETRSQLIIPQHEFSIQEQREGKSLSSNSLFRGTEDEHENELPFYLRMPTYIGGVFYSLLLRLLCN